MSAGVDYPISLFWKDMVKMYPNAKVRYGKIRSRYIPTRYHLSFKDMSLVSMFSLSLNENQVLLNDRDPVRWYESVKNTILNVVKLLHLVLRIGVDVYFFFLISPFISLRIVDISLF